MEQRHFRLPPLALPALITVCLWWLSTPFFNLTDHDGLLYTGSAIARLEPLRFGADLFFQVDLQNQLSVYSRLFAALIAEFGVFPAGFLMAALGRVLWLVGMGLLVSAVAQRSQRPAAALPGLALALLLPAYYGGFTIFSYGEAFPTPRCWAEAAVLASLACQVRARVAWAWGLMLVAAALHPLMALPGGLLLTCMQPARVRNLLMGIGALGVALAAALDVPPFANLLVFYDAEWWSAVVRRNYYLLPMTWEVEWFVKVACWPILLAYVGLTHPDAAMRRTAQALAGVLTGCLLVWLWGSEAQNVLIVQLQLWRALWLGQLLAPVLWVSGLPDWRTWTARERTHVLLVMAAILSSSWTVNMGLPLAVLGMHPRFTQFWQAPLVRRWAVVFGGLMLLIALPAHYQMMLIRKQEYLIGRMPWPELAAWCVTPIFTLPLVGWVAWAWRRDRAFQIGGLVLALGLSAGVVNSVAHHLKKSWEPRPDASALTQRIPPEAVVYWDNDVEGAWLLLRRAHYASIRQATGALFSRPVAIEAERRIRVLRTAGLPTTEALPSMAQLEALCQEPELDFILLNGHVPGMDEYLPLPGAPMPEISLKACHPAAAAGAHAR